MSNMAGSVAEAEARAASEAAAVSYNGSGVFVISMLLVFVGSLCSMYQNRQVIHFIHCICAICGLV
jgi:hypothetical protein